MDSTEKIVKHLEMIQTVINRLGSNFFLIKRLEHDGHCHGNGFNSQT